MTSSLELASNVSALIIIKNYMFLKGELFSKAQQCVLVSALLIKTKSCLSLHNCTLSKSLKTKQIEPNNLRVLV